MKITIGSVVITDNGSNDGDPAANVIKFNSQGPTGFQLPANSSVKRISGTVELSILGTVVQFLPPGGVSLVLTKLNAAADPTGQLALTVSFEHEFAAPAAPVKAGETLKGKFSDLTGVSMSGSSLGWAAYVNGVRIQPPNAAFNLVNAANAPANVPIAPPSGGPMTFNSGGPPWTLKGELIIQLAAQGHALVLPDSAEIGIAPAIGSREQQQQIPMPRP